jgi:repressor LexA
MGNKLTPKQETVLTLIRDCYLQNGYAPSLGELQQKLGFNSKRGVVNHLVALENKGYILRSSKARGIQLLNEEDDNNIEYEYLIGIPIFGYANAGTPLSRAEEDNIGILNVDKKIVGNKGKNLFGLIVKGDSMNLEDIDGQKIVDGKYLIVEKDADVSDGDVVVAIIDNCATVKRISLSQKDIVVLYPRSSNPIHQPIYLDTQSDFLINGKVVKVLDNPMRIT